MFNRILMALIILFGLAPGFQTSPQQPISQGFRDINLHEEAEGFSVEFFPVAPHYVGDVLSLRVSYSGDEDIAGTKIQLAQAEMPDEMLEETTFSGYNQQAIFYWALNTKNRTAEFTQFILSIPEMGLSWQAGVNLLPQPDQDAGTWEEVLTACCTIHYMSGTDAERDILQIQQILETQANQALSQFESVIDPGEQPLEDPLALVLIPTVIGQGGFATDIAVITYSDRNWTGTAFSFIAHHEIVHVIDRQLNSGQRPSLFAEGLAVYFSRGHYREGDPLQRAAALLTTGHYIPLEDFVDDFYAAQHEISYLEAAGLVAYLHQIWGRDTFLDFYFNLPEGNQDSDIISSALKDQFGMTLAELEEDYVAYLRSIPPDPEVQVNVHLTIRTYDLMRRYQKVRIPSAYFRNAWWPPLDRVLEMGIVGDYAPREKTPVDVIIENLFLDVYPALDSGDYQTVEENLNQIESFLDLAEATGEAFSHYSIGWPIPYPAFTLPGF